LLRHKLNLAHNFLASAAHTVRDDLHYLPRLSFQFASLLWLASLHSADAPEICLLERLVNAFLESWTQVFNLCKHGLAHLAVELDQAVDARCAHILHRMLHTSHCKLQAVSQLLLLQLHSGAVLQDFVECVVLACGLLI
jgi:hypothetical protein